jgi:hypothetical protein
MAEKKSFQFSIELINLAFAGITSIIAISAIIII